MLVTERFHLQDDALVRGAAGQPVELGTTRLQHRQTEVSRALADLVDTLIAADADGDVQSD